MDISMTYKRKVIRIAALFAALLTIAGCAGVQPYNPHNHREEGPAKGLFTGSQGEWVIVGPKQAQTSIAENRSLTSDTETDREPEKKPQESADGGQQ